MARLDIEAEIETYFISNWTDTTIQIQDRKFDYDGIDKWIAIQYAPTINTQIGFDGTATGRTSFSGLSVIYCYHKTKPLLLKLVDDVILFFKGQELPLDIHIGIAQDSNATNLENGFWEVKLNFDVSQYA